MANVAVMKPKMTLTQVLHGVRPRLQDSVASSPVVSLCDPSTTIRSQKAPSSFKLSNRLPPSSAKALKASTRTEKEDVEIFHEKKTRYFENLQKSLPSKRAQLNKCTNDSHERAKLQREIEAIENRQEETSYFFGIFDIVNEYKASSTGATDQEDDDTTTYADQVDSVMSDLSSIQNCSTICDILTKRDNTVQLNLSNEYYRLVDPSRVNVESLYTTYQSCEECTGTLFMINGFYSCGDCGLDCPEAGGDHQWSYKDIQDISYKTNFSYKRLTRFRDLLNSIQAKENTEIPESVIEAVKAEIAKDQPRSLQEINMDRIKYYLKRTGNNKYYEHRAYIIDRIKGKPPVLLPPETEEELVQMFISIQEPFEEVRKIITPERTSFLSYQYVCYKFFELLGMNDKLKFFPLLKSREKLDVQDRIWKGICDRLSWEFYRST